MQGATASLSVDGSAADVIEDGRESPDYYTTRACRLINLRITNGSPDNNSDGEDEPSAEGESSNQTPGEEAASRSPPRYDPAQGSQHNAANNGIGERQQSESQQAPPPGYTGPRDESSNENDEEIMYLPSYPPTQIDVEVLTGQLASLISLADQVVAGLNQYASKGGYERKMRCIIGELTALHMTLTNLESVFKPSSQTYLDFWLETLELVLHISGEPLGELLKVVSGNGEDGGAGAASSSSPKRKRFSKSSFFSKDSKKRDEVTDKIIGYEKRTVPYTQMFNLLYTSCLPGFPEEREASIERVLKLLKDPSGLGHGMDIRLGDDVPIEILGHWIPEIVMVDGVEFPKGSIGVVVKKDKTLKRIFVELVMDERDDRTLTYIVSGSAYCERGVGNDPVILHDLMRSEREDEGFDDVYIWLNSWLETDGLCLSLTALKWLNYDWFPKASKDRRTRYRPCVWPQRS